MTRKKTFAEFEEQANKVHNFKYDYSIFNYVNAKIKSTIICPIEEHGEFQQSPDSHINKGSGCIKCSTEETHKQQRSNTFEFVQRAIKIHGDLYNYDKVDYKRADEPVIITCKNHNKDFEQRPASHLKGAGCPICAGNLPLNNEIIDNKLKGRNVIRLGNYINVDYKIEWQCLECNEKWFAIPYSVVNMETGCMKCGGRFPISNEIFDERIKNRNILRLDNIINCRTKIKFECKECSYIWMTVPDAIMRGGGCPACSFGKNENLTYEILNKNMINVIRQFNIDVGGQRPYRLDFYFEEIKLAIEYNGAQHYRPVKFGGMSQQDSETNFIKQQARDKYVREFCKNNGIKLIEIDGRKYQNNKLKDYLENKLIPSIKNKLTTIDT